MHHHLTSPALSLANRFVVCAVFAALVSLAFAEKSSAIDPITSLVSKNTLSYSDSAVVLQDGSGVLFDTVDSLLPADTDSHEDVYLNKDGAITLLTDGLAESVGLQLVGATDDGSTIYVETTSRLNPLTEGDDGPSTDAYAVKNGVATLVSTTESDPNDSSVGAAARFEGVTPDGSVVFFSSAQQYDLADLDSGAVDLYSYKPNAVGTKGAFVSTAASELNQSAGVNFCGASDNGNVVAWQTTAPMLATDLDASSMDTYVRSSGVTSLASTKLDNNLSTAGNADCRGVSQNGSTVAFESSLQFFAADDVSNRDVFTYNGGSTRWISTSSASDLSTPTTSTFGAMSGDGQTVWFSTSSALVAEDTDTTDLDGYRRDGSNNISWLTDGSLALDQSESRIQAVSRDGRAVLFSSNDPYVAGDDDEENQDLYVKYDDGPAQHVSTGPGDTNALVQATPLFQNEINRRWTISATGDRIGFYTTGPLVSEDTDGQSDVYQFTIPKPVVQVPAPTPVPSVDTLAPSITSAKLSNTTFAVDKQIKALTVAKSKLKKGTKISFTLSEAASVKLAFESRTSGRKSGSKCVKQTSKNKSAKKCTIIKTVKTAKLVGVAGSNTLSFGGRIGGTTLKSGEYQLAATATDASGNAGTSKPAKFTVVNP